MIHKTGIGSAGFPRRRAHFQDVELLWRAALRVGLLSAVLFCNTLKIHGVELNRVGHWLDPGLGYVYGVSVSGNFAYVQTQNGLQIFDISSRTNPAHVSATGLFPAKVIASGEFAYLIGTNGFEILSLSNPISPTRLGGIANIDGSGGIAVSGSFAYVAGRSADFSYTTLSTVDITDPGDPVLKGTIHVGGWPQSLAVSDSLAYLGAGGTLWIIRLYTPTNLLPLGSLYLTNRSIDGVVLSGSYAYVLTGDFGPIIHIIDISNPHNPIRAGTFPATYPSYFTVSGNRAYVSDSGAGLKIFDLSVPTAPSLVGRFFPRFRPANDIAFSGDYAYLTEGVALEVVNVNNPTNPVSVGHVITRGSSSLAVAVANDYAYVADEYAGLQVIDTSDPTNPKLQASYYTATYPRDLAAAGNYAYLLDSSNRLQVFDISNPSIPLPVGSWTTTNFLSRITVSSNLAFIGFHNAGLPGLAVLDLRDPTKPAQVGNYFSQTIFPERAGARGVKVAGNYAYLAYGGARHGEFGDQSIGGFDVIDVSNPTHPVPAVQNRSPSSWDIAEAAPAGNYVYSTYYTQPYSYCIPCPLSFCCYSFPQTGGFAVWDISNPTNRVLVRSLETGYQYSGVVISGGYAFVLPSSLIDISNPTQPVWQTNLYDFAWRIAMSGQLAYAASGDQGLQIYCLGCPRLSATMVEGQVLLQWPQSSTNFLLETRPGLHAPWQAVSRTPQLTNGFYQLALPPEDPSALFRLRSTR